MSVTNIGRCKVIARFQIVPNKNEMLYGSYMFFFLNVKTGLRTNPISFGITDIETDKPIETRV